MNFSSTPKENHPVMITIAVMLGTLMQVLDTTIANVALPDMQGTLSATQDQIAWVLTSYIVGAAIMTPPTGWLAGRFGRRRIYLISILGFTTASLLCGVSTSLAEIVFFRVLQGLFGAALVPISQAILLDTYPREKHGVAMAIFGIGIMLGPIIGPTLGGWLTEYYSWRWVFFINIPVGIFAIFMTLAYVPETVINRTRTFDAIGFLFMSLAIGALQMMLDRGESLDWFNSVEILIEAGLVLIGMWLFVLHVIDEDHPYIELSIFKDRNFLVTTVLAFVVFLGLFSTMSLIPPFLQNLLDYPVLTTGLILMPRGVGTMLSMVVVGRLSTKIDPRLNIAVGLVIMAVALNELGRMTTQVDTWFLVWTGFVQGVGMGQVIVPLTTMAFSTLPPEKRTEASGFYNLIRNIGGSLGISITFTLLEQSTQINHAELAQHITPFNPAIALHGLNAGMSASDPARLEMLNGLITKQAAMIGFNNDFTLVMLVSLAALPLVLLLRNPHYGDTPENDTESAAMITE